MEESIFSEVVNNLLNSNLIESRNKLERFSIEEKHRLSNMSEEKQRNLAVKYYQLLLQNRAKEISETWLFSNL